MGEYEWICEWREYVEVIPGCWDWIDNIECLDSLSAADDCAKEKMGIHNCLHVRISKAYKKEDKHHAETLLKVPEEK